MVLTVRKQKVSHLRRIWGPSAGSTPRCGSPSRLGGPIAAEVVAHPHSTTVLRTGCFDGAVVRNHAKFIVIDHRLPVVTSANLSWSAERGNVEFGGHIDGCALVEDVERELLDVEGVLYGRVFGSTNSNG